MKSLLLLFLAYRAVLLKEKFLKKSKFFIEKMKNKKEGFFEKIIFVYSGIAHWNPCSPLSSNMPDPFRQDLMRPHTSPVRIQFLTVSTRTCMRRRGCVSTTIPLLFPRHDIRTAYKLMSMNKFHSRASPN